MPFEVSWLYPKRLVYVRYYGRVTLAELQAQIRETDACIAEATAPMHFIINALEVEHYDITLGQIRALFPEIDPKVGWTVLYGPNKIARFLASLMMQMVKGNFRFVASYEEALSFIARVDPTLEKIESELSQK